MADHAVTSSYITTTELADAYFANDPRTSAIAFLALTTDQKAWYLQRATKIMDALPLKGSTYYYIDKTSPSSDEQELQFPRVINEMVVSWDDSTSAAVVPQEVKDACCEEALSLYDFYVASDDDQKRRKLQTQGVSSFSLGDLSENYGGISAASKWKGLHSQESYDLMKQYIAGAVRTL